ncbi:BPSS1780 family membrane protein [Chromobacterium subtsugae]|uniref:BPSS1780 family membrane protein n=1 Tax=Chromobacterium subtsugae TaxID=251747 RepID=UPI0006412CCC|nr:BPSS1780 family membrane protein [Chromobacterium subtsugae]
MESAIHIRAVEARQGWRWIADGYQLFRQQKLAWVLMGIAYLAITLLLSMLPLAGQVLLGVSAPLFTAGYLLATAKQRRGETIKVSDLFLGWQQHLQPLAGYCLLLLPITLAGGLIAEHIVESSGARHQLLVFGEVLLWLFSIACMFIVPLITFSQATLWPALRLSVGGVQRNWGPLLVYFLAILLLAMLSVFTLGLALLVLIPVVYISLFMAWRDIFAGDVDLR